MKKYRYSLFGALSIFALVCGSIANAQTISTVAGPGMFPTGFPTAPTEGVPATSTSTYYVTPYGITKSGSTLYIADENDNCIRAVDAAGIVTLFAGVPTLFGATFSGDGGAATAANLKAPVDVATDAAGNLYIADNGNGRVRMVNITTGIITTIAGNLTTGGTPPYGDGGPATAATVRISPAGIAVDPTGSPIYVSDAAITGGGSHNIVRVLTSTGGGSYNIATYAGNGITTTPVLDGGAATAAHINGPRGLFLDAAGNLYIADMSHHAIRKVDFATNNISTVAGTAATTGGFLGDGAAATAGKLNGPTDVFLSAAGDMYIADAGNNRVRYVDHVTGNFSTIAGDNTAAPAPFGDGGAATAAYLNVPVSVTPDGTTGNYYISDQSHTSVRYVDVSAIANVAPTFVHGGTQSLTVCENSGANNINTNLAINDPDIGQTETWSILTGPFNGTAVVAYTATSTGSALTPSGLTYTPNPGYSGTDVFRVQINDGHVSATTTINVTVNPLPAIAAIGGPSSVCVGSSITLTETTTGGSWVALNGNASVVGGTVTGNVGGTDDIYYAVTNACGTDSAVKTITINPSVVPSVTVSSTLGTSTCSVPGTFTAVTIGGGTAPQYQWSVAGGAVTGATNSSYTYIPVSGDIVSVQLTSNAPCASPLITTGSITMSGSSTILPAISISTGIGDTFCVGIPVTFTSTITNGGLTPSFVWTVGGTPVATGSTFDYTPTLASAGEVIECQLTSSIPCALPSTVASNDVTVHLRASAAATLHINAAPGIAVCDGTSATYSAAQTGGGSSPSFRWTRNGINVATGPTYTCVPADSDVIYCTMHSSIACSPSDSVLSNNIIMTVEPVITPVVTIAASQTLTGVRHLVIFTATVTSLTFTPTFQWYINGTALPGATSSSFIFTDSVPTTAIVNCVVNSGDACNRSGISNLVTVTLTNVGVGQLSSAATEMKLVPNPNKGVFTMNLVSDYDEAVDIVITNILGEKVKELTAATNKTVDIKLDQSPGIYFLSATTGHGRNEAKVVVN